MPLFTESVEGRLQLADLLKQAALLVPVDPADHGPQVSLVENANGRQKQDPSRSRTFASSSSPSSGDDGCGGARSLSEIDFAERRINHLHAISDWSFSVSD